MVLRLLRVLGVLIVKLPRNWRLFAVVVHELVRRELWRVRCLMSHVRGL